MNMAMTRNRFLADTVATAGPQQILVMLYDRLVLDLNRAESAQRTGQRARRAPTSTTRRRSSAASPRRSTSRRGRAGRASWTCTCSCCARWSGRRSAATPTAPPAARRSSSRCGTPGARPRPRSPPRDAPHPDAAPPCRLRRADPGRGARRRMTAVLAGLAPAPAWSTAWADALAELEMSVDEAEALLLAARRTGARRRRARPDRAAGSRPPPRTAPGPARRPRPRTPGSPAPRRAAARRGRGAQPSPGAGRRGHAGDRRGRPGLPRHRRLTRPRRPPRPSATFRTCAGPRTVHKVAAGPAECDLPHVCRAPNGAQGRNRQIRRVRPSARVRALERCDRVAAGSPPSATSARAPSAVHGAPASAACDLRTCRALTVRRRTRPCASGSGAQSAGRGQRAAWIGSCRPPGARRGAGGGRRPAPTSRTAAAR